MRALRYFVSEALGSLRRRPGAALVAIVTMAIGIFVLGLFLLVSANLRGPLERWSEAAELSIFLADDATRAQVAEVEASVDASGVAAERRLVSKADALARFSEDFPDLAPTAQALEGNPFPASIEVRLRQDVEAGRIDGLVGGVAGMPGVSDVRYDRQWLERLNAVVRGLRLAVAIVVAILAVAAVLTVANVVRLAAAARGEELEIMQLVGAPLTYVRGPFVMEGILQGGIGGLIALAGLAAIHQLIRSAYQPSIAQALGLDEIAFVSAPVAAMLVLGGMLVGALGSYAAARQVR